ncbi:MAG: hypothetical protein CMJ83_17655 [Planctomycetes bacterium]|nr:hypothetical protein [Planctomycetota bacterium]
MKTTNVLIIVLLTAAATVPAQHFTQAGEVVVSSSLTAKSVQPAGDHVFVSTVNSGQQISVDVTNPQSPTVVGGIFNPNYSDQFTDGCWTPLFGGRLFTAHRFGGINMLDTSNPLALATDATIVPGAATSNYSHEGLKIWTNDCYGPVGPMSFLFYGECHTSSTGPSSLGGLRIFQVGSGYLNEVGTSLNTELGGMSLDVSRDGQHCFQIAVQDLNQTTEARRLVVYDVSNPWSPSICANIPMGGTSSYFDADIEINDDTTYAYAAVGYDGLQVIDANNPCVPTISTYIANPILFIRGLTFYRKNVLLVSGRINTPTPIDFFASLNVGASPTSPPLISLHVTDMNIRDMKVENGMVYLVGSRTNGDQVLQTWL